MATPQLSLFAVNKRKKETAKDNLERVRSRIEMSIMEFWGSLEIGTEFHVAELNEYINADGITCAPDSPGRIMRLLKHQGDINYTVVSRKESLYRVLPT